MAANQPESAVAKATLADRVRREVDHAIQRRVKGLRYLVSSDPPVGVTPKDAIHARGTLVLYHYRPQCDDVYRVPVLLIMSLVSRPYILDLAPGQSLVEFLLRRGLDVYLVDWGVPRPEDSRLRLEDYVLDFMPDCIERVCADSGESELSILGYCMGGLLSTLYAALHAEGPLHNLACFTTPVDFDGMGLMRQWVDPSHFDVDHVVDSLGNVPPELVLASFDLLRPVSRLAARVRLWDNLWNDDFVHSYRVFQRWANDQIPFPGETFRQLVKELQWPNSLCRGEFHLGGRRIDLSRIRVPFLHVLAEHDHIVPYDAGRPLVDLVGSEDREQLVLNGGHVSLVAGPHAQGRMWPRLEAWLAQRST
jgi:polyhydroxyalkanoate synthase